MGSPFRKKYLSTRRPYRMPLRIALINRVPASHSALAASLTFGWMQELAAALSRGPQAKRTVAPCGHPRTSWPVASASPERNGRTDRSRTARAPARALPIPGQAPGHRCPKTGSRSSGSLGLSHRQHVAAPTKNRRVVGAALAARAPVHGALGSSARCHQHLAATRAPLDPDRARRLHRFTLALRARRAATASKKLDSGETSGATSHEPSSSRAWI